jgi:hypothetical protein
MKFWDKLLLSSIGFVSLGILSTSRVPSKSNTNNPSVSVSSCIPLEVVKERGSKVGIDIDIHINNQVSVNGSLQGTLDTTHNCVQGLSPKTVDALEQAQAQQAERQ